MPVRKPPMNKKLSEVPTVDIPEGDFLYVMCKIYERGQEGPESDCKHIIRGEERTEFHVDIFDLLESICDNMGISCYCQGGGKMNHDAGKKQIHVYGTSKAYGAANHKLAANVIKDEYPDYNDITWCYD